MGPLLAKAWCMATTRKKSPRKRKSTSTVRKRKSTSTARKRSSSGRRYGKAASESVETAMSELKRGELRSGRSGKKVTSRKQAIAIGLSQARKRGAKVPRQKSE
jgi:hypothetical protein